MIDRFNSRQQINGRRRSFSVDLSVQSIVSGTIYLTSTHLIFVDPEGKRETWVRLTNILRTRETSFHHFQILKSLISSVEKLPTTQHGCPLRVRTRHFLSMEFIIPKERECTDLYTTLNQLIAGRRDRTLSPTRLCLCLCCTRFR